MHKSFFIIILFILQTTVIRSQTITVLNVEDKQPIPAAHILIKDVEHGEEKLFLTDDKGKAQLSGFENLNGKYLLSLSFIGFKKLTDTLNGLTSKTYLLAPEKTILNELVVTAQYAPNSSEKAVHKIKVIDSKKIEAIGAVNLHDVLSNELNIRLSQDNILGSSMSLQGISGQNVKILLDGVPVTGRMNGNIDLSQINMNNVERIEIIEGPLSVNYGTDALGGTINIITKKSQKQNLSFVSDNYYESIGQYNFSGKAGYKHKKNLITVSGGRNYFDGWRPDEKHFQLEKVRVADSLRYKNWKPKEQLFGTLYYSHFFNELKLGYAADYFFEKITNRGLPRLPYFETALDDYYTTKRMNNTLNLNGKLSKYYYLNFTAAYNHYERIKSTYFKDLTTLEQVLTENADDQDTSLFNTLMTRGSISSTRDSVKINYELGYDVNQETARGLRIKDMEQVIGDYALFGSAEYKPFTFLTFRPGLRATYNTSYKAPVVPSLNIKYDVPIGTESNSSLAFRFSYARGFRSPSLKELYFYFVDINHNITGNQNLKAEQSDNYNLSISLNKTKSQRVSKLDLSIFYNYIHSMIALAQASGTQYTYFNIDKYETRGLQLQNEFAIKHFKIATGAAYIGRYNQMGNKKSPDGFEYSPEARCNIFYEWHSQNMTFALFYKYTGKLAAYALNENDELYKIQVQDYHSADATLSRAFIKKSIILTAGAKNLFDVKNIRGIASGAAHTASSNTMAVGMGRSYFFKITININSKN